MHAITRMRSFAVACALCLGAALWLAAAPRAAAQESSAWDGETLHALSVLPVQDGGRVKPLSTYAAFKLLKFNGRRNFKDETGRKVHPMEWMADCLFRPEAAIEHKTFLVEDTEALTPLGISSEGKKKRDRCSYAELLPGRDKLYDLARQYSALPEEQQTRSRQQLVNLAHNVYEFEELLHYFDFARHEFPIEAVQLPGKQDATFTGVLRNAQVLRVGLAVLEHGVESLDQFVGEENAARMREALPEGIGELDPDARAKRLEALRNLLGQIDEMGLRATALALIPPGGTPEENPEWLTPAEMVQAAFFPEFDIGQQLDALEALEALGAAKAWSTEFKTALSSFSATVAGLARARGEYDKVGLEVTFYNLKLFYRSLIFYIMSFVLVALLWMRPESRVLGALAALALVVATVLLSAGIGMRCVIRSRPPVTTLYETILFTTAVTVVVALFIEYVNRRRLALSLAALLGTVGMFLANKYEVREGVDTMPAMVAVLDTNFWLSTHVTTIIMGYAAGLLAAAMGHIYLFGRLAGIRRQDEAFYRGLAGMTYGVLCFGLLFAFIGTVFGGIWAAEAWGRFWGWDPKENGALLIVLWLLAVVHARLGGYISDLGVCISAVVAGMIVTFSWWGINLLGVGMHSYGFTSGILLYLVVFYVLEGAVLLAGMALWFRQKSRRRSSSRPRVSGPK